MTEADINRIEAELGICVPSVYRRVMVIRNDERRRLQTDGRLYTNAEQVIECNRFSSSPDGDLEEGFPGWNERFFLIGDNTAGDYFSIRFEDETIWMIGTDCGDPHQLYEPFEDFVDDMVWESRKHTESCPVERWINIFIGKSTIAIQCPQQPQPLLKEMIKELGFDLDAVIANAFRVVATLTNCDSRMLSVNDVTNNSAGALVLKFLQPQIRGDLQWSGAGTEIIRDRLMVYLYETTNQAPKPEFVGINWRAFRAAIADLLEVLYPSCRVTISLPDQWRLSKTQWTYDFGYRLDEAA